MTPFAWFEKLAWTNSVLTFGCALLVCSSAARAGEAAPPIAPGPQARALEGEKPAPPAKGIQDNSFLVEEAYNQEPGVVQHIFTAQRSIDRRPGTDDKSWDLSFTQEWPVVSQDHQLSYTVPYSMLDEGGVSSKGVGDVAINYRWQALYESERQPAFSPRFSLLLPTGDEDRGFGSGRAGYQLNLPLSKVVGERWTFHFNAGTTIRPGMRVRLDDGSHSSRRTLVDFNLGASAIYAVTSRFNLMLEYAGNDEQGFNAQGKTTREYTAVISPGTRFAFSLPKARDAQLVVGVAAPIGLNRKAPDIGAFLYLSFEHSF
ncbi:MAG: transporter [Planctomycetota bacterium]|nr:transporter [Planctomycetota bacterium]